MDLSMQMIVILQIIANLINICEDCHNEIHKNNKRLKSKKVTNGYELI